MGSPKSAMTAGILGILLGAFGVHDWYLDNHKKARSHVILAIVGGALMGLSIILRALMQSANKVTTINLLGNIATTLYVIAWLAIAADVIWGIIEGILLLVQGDAGLAAKGYTVLPPKPKTEEEEYDPNAVSMIAPARPANNAMPANYPNTAVPTQPTAGAAPMPAQYPPSPVENSQAATPAPQPGPVTLPPAPTLAEQASNAPASAQPIVFKSSDIANQGVSANVLGQTLSTKSVEPAPLMTTKTDGSAAMNPVVKRKILITIVVLVAAVIIGIIIKVGVDSVLASGYGTSYRIAKDLQPRLANANQSSSCQYALDYAKSAYVDRKTYNGYVDSCKDLVTGVGALVSELGDTPGVLWNGEISAQYQNFKELYNETFPEGSGDNLTSALTLYQTWHEYVLAADTLTVDSEDSEFQQAADFLRTSGNKTLADYGEEWLQKELDYVRAYQTYRDLSYTDPAKEDARLAVDERRTELKNFVDDHRPDVTMLEKMTVPDTKAMYESFTKLYDLIRAAYEKHYDYDSGDCRNLGGVVYCQ